MQLLAILKPDGTLRRAAGAGVLNGLVQSNLCSFLTFRQVQAPLELIERHYEHIKKRSFYPWLVKYMMGGPSYIILLETDEEYTSQLRELLGATRAEQASPGTLRYKYASYAGANCLHLSDSAEAAEIEVPMWTNYFSLEPGQFDIAVDDYIRRYIDGPNQSLLLRELCIDIAAAGYPISDVNKQKLRELIASECYDSSPEEVDFVVWVTEGACLS